MSWLYDDRTECFSVQLVITIGDYLELVRKAYSQKGALGGQRDALKTTTAKRIRERMVNDIRRGTVLPPVVLGVVVSNELFSRYPIDKASKVQDFIPGEFLNDVAIIDGMQRTTALQEAVDVDLNVARRLMRVEFWLTRSVNAMVYRMLVLNTGQVPWTLARQLSVVYAPLLEEINKKVPNIGRIHTPDKPGRRVQSGEYSSDALVELYIAFNLRKTSVDTKEALSDEFSRLDIVENVSDEKFQEHFYSVLSMLTELDHAFSRYDSGLSGRFSKGRNVFDGQPSRIGFVAAVAQHAIGRPGMERERTDRDKRMSSLESACDRFCRRLGEMSKEELGEFLTLDVLSEMLDRRVGQVGRYERGLFFEAFRVMIDEDFELQSMEPCWRAS